MAADDVHENAFWHADLTEAASHLVEVIREVRPQVMVTYDEFGGYGHPDHIQAHRVATYAAALAAVPSYRRGPRTRPTTSPRSTGARCRRAGCGRDCATSARPATPPRFEGMDPDNLPAVHGRGRRPGSRDRGRRLRPREDGGLRAHRTQIAVDGPFFALSNNKGNEIWGTEHFRIAKGALGPAGDNGLESDLFAGLG